MNQRDTAKARLMDEKLRVLLGETPSTERAVRMSELDRLVTDIAGAVINSRFGTETDEDVAGSDDAAVDSFHNGARDPGFYHWENTSRFRPPTGRAGPAVYMKRKNDRGAWLASVTEGTSGSYAARLFLKGASGVQNDFNPTWREIYHEENVLGAVAQLADGTVDGALWEVSTSASGTLIRCANGYQIAFRTDMTLIQTTSTTVEGTWTYPAVFTETPVVIPILPGTIGDYTDIDRTTISHWEVNTITSLSLAILRARAANGSAAWSATAEIDGVGVLAFGKWA